MAPVDPSRPITSALRVRCKARNRAGQPCKAWAVRGATVCSAHGGLSPQVRRAAARRLALGEAEAALVRLGRPVDVDPADAMLAMVHEAAGNVAVLRRLVQSLGDRVDQEPGRVADEDGRYDDAMRDDLGHGIAGRVDPANWKAAPHVWVAMYDAERERLVRWAKACRDAGVDERRVQVAEEQGRQLAGVLTAAFDGLKAALLSAAAPRELVDRIWQENLPGIVRGAIDAVHREETPGVA